MAKTVRGTDQITPLVMTGAYLTRCIRAGDDMRTVISELTTEQQEAIRRGDAEIIGDTNTRLAIKGTW